jgi:large subunit ribosomal protein L30
MATPANAKDKKEGTSKAAAPKATASKVSKRTITIRLAKGRIACNPVQRATINGLGLKHREQVRTLENTPAVRGMIKKVLHLVEVVSETR